jgi:hypothetical protein
MIEPLWFVRGRDHSFASIQIAEFGGAPGIRDRNLPDPPLSDHFFDGNKRVRFQAVLVFLRLHDLILKAPASEATQMMLALAAGQKREALIATCSLWPFRFGGVKR